MRKIQALKNKSFLRDDRGDMSAGTVIGVMVTVEGNIEIKYNRVNDSFTTFDDTYGERTIPNRMVVENTWLSLTPYGLAIVEKKAKFYQKKFPPVLQELEQDMDNQGISEDEYEIPEVIDEVLEVVETSAVLAKKRRKKKADISPENDEDIQAHNKLEAALKNLGFTMISKPNDSAFRSYNIRYNNKRLFDLGVTDTQISKKLESLLSTAIGVSGFRRVEGQWPEITDTVRFVAEEPNTLVRFEVNVERSDIAFYATYK